MAFVNKKEGEKKTYRPVYRVAAQLKIKFVIATAIADRNNKTGKQNCWQEK